MATLNNLRMIQIRPLLLAVLGMMFMVSSVDFIAIYVALELMSLSVYVLVSMTFYSHSHTGINSGRDIYFYFFIFYDITF